MIAPLGGNDVVAVPGPRAKRLALWLEYIVVGAKEQEKYPRSSQMTFLLLHNEVTTYTGNIYDNQP